MKTKFTASSTVTYSPNLLVVLFGTVYIANIVPNKTTNKFGGRILLTVEFLATF